MLEALAGMTRCHGGCGSLLVSPLRICFDCAVNLSYTGELQIQNDGHGRYGLSDWPIDYEFRSDKTKGTQ